MSDGTLTAFFEELVTTYYSLSISAPEGGDTDPKPSEYMHEAGTTITVLATPFIDYDFDFWILDGEERTSNPINITMDKDHVLIAYFIKTQKCPYPYRLLCKLWWRVPWLRQRYRLRQRRLEKRKT